MDLDDGVEKFGFLCFRCCASKLHDCFVVIVIPYILLVIIIYEMVEYVGNDVHCFTVCC